MPVNARKLLRRIAIVAGVLALGAWSSCTNLAPDARWRVAVAAPPHTITSPLVDRPDAPLRWVRRFAVARPYAQACDLASTPAGLVVAASRSALGEDGAAVYRWRDGGALETLLTWEGQGFLRVHAYGDTLLVPDADAPFRTVPFLFDLDVDGYVFVSSPTGTLTRDGRELLPAVYHVFDVARLADGHAVASTGAYFPSRIPYVMDGAPAALFVDDGAGRPWRRARVDPPAVRAGVYRYTFLEALNDGSLLAGVESPEGYGAVRIENVLGASRVTRVTGPTGFVLRWASRGCEVFASVQESGASALWRSDDCGRSFARVTGLAGDAQGMVMHGGRLGLLLSGALWVEREDGTFTERVAAHAALAHGFSSLVSAPLVVHRGRFWAASTTTGEVFEAAP